MRETRVQAAAGKRTCERESEREAKVKVKVRVTVRASSKEGSTELGARFTPEPCRPSAPPPPWPLNQFQHAFPGRDFAATRAVFGGALRYAYTYCMLACINPICIPPPQRHQSRDHHHDDGARAQTPCGRKPRYLGAASVETLFCAKRPCRPAVRREDGSPSVGARARGYGGTRWLP
jgi:hypothetical protein